MRAHIKTWDHKLDSTGISGLFVCVFLALLYAYFLLPHHFISGTSSFWNTQTEDITTYQAGFHAFFREPWQWPLLRINSLNWPEGTLATFLDIIPLYAALLKVFAPQDWFPFNPFGGWIFICILMQAIAAWWILREAQVRNWVVLLVFTLVLLATPSWLNRMSHHTSLFSHWILLFGFALILRDQRSRQFSLWAWFFLISSAIFINLYLAMMAGLMALSSWLARFYEKPHIALLGKSVLAFFTLVVLMAIAMWPLPPNSAASESGFGLYSLNLASPWSGGRFMQIQPDAHSREQGFEGFNYLGLGVISLLFLSGCIAAYQWVTKQSTPSDQKLSTQAIYPATLWWLFLAFFLYALSNQIYWGAQLLAQWPIPDWAQAITGQFRVSGRFFWPVGYGLIIFVVIYVYRQCKEPYVAASLLIAGLIQLTDVSSLIRTTQLELHRASPPVIDLSEWQSQIPASVKTLYVFPKIKCNTKSSFFDTQLPLTLFASVNGLNVNTAYMARYNPSCANEVTEIAASDFRTSAYLFVNAEYPESTIRSFFSANVALECRNMAPFTLCLAHANP